MGKLARKMKISHPASLLLLVLLTVASYSSAANALNRGTQVKKFSIPTTGVGLLQFSFAGKRYKRCTGTAISSNMVLTSLSCLYDSERDELATSASILPHATRATSHDTPRFFVKRVWFYEKALSLKRKNVPFFTIGAESLAVLEIADEPASQLKVYGYQGRTLSKRSSGKGRGTVIGYSSATSDPHIMWQHTCEYRYQLGELAKDILLSECQLTDHAIGSPILNKDNYIFGIMIGSLPSSSVFGQMSERHFEDLTSLIEEKKPSRGMTSIDLKLNRAYGLNLKNECNKKIQVAI